MYLGRCQHDTPDEVVRRVWEFIGKHRTRISKVVDFGAGDGRFALGGKYDRYIGYEIDPDRTNTEPLPTGATIWHSCAFSSTITDACLSVGNPPFVRNQDLPRGWRKKAADVIAARTGAKVSGLANAWQYFAFLALASTKGDGLVALLMPYEWVSRPSAKALRDFVIANKWNADVYRLRDETFDHVLTTASITVIDKRARECKWRYFEEASDGAFREVTSPTGATLRVIDYSRRRRDSEVFARRGLSPGTQKLLILTERERKENGLKVGTDVVRCVTSLRSIGADCQTLTERVFNADVMKRGAKCWLIRTDGEPSKRLREYLNGTPKASRRTSTCQARKEWWRFTMPNPPSILVATGFSGARPKAVRNAVGAIAVGSVSGVFGLGDEAAKEMVRALHVSRFHSRIVAHANGLRKVEVGQLETFLHRKVTSLRSRSR